MSREKATGDAGRDRSRQNGSAFWGGSATRYRRDARGVASIEMAFIFPLLLIVFIGLVDLSNLLSANRRVTLTASTLGDLVTQSPGDVKVADLKGFISAARPIMDPFPATSTSLEFYAFTNSEGTMKLDWTYKSAGANCGAAPTPDDTMQKLMAQGNDVVVSRACYEWEPVLGIVLGFKTTTIQDQIMLRPRQSARIVCADC